MQFWEPLEFGVLAASLRATALKPAEEIRKIQRARLQQLVRHARQNSPLYRQKFAGVRDSSFRLADLPTSTKAELMTNFERALTVRDVRRGDVEKFFENEANLGKLFLGKYVVSHTSGSQGQPLVIVQPPENLELLFALHVSRGNHESLTFLHAVKHLVAPARLAVVLLQRGFYPSAAAFEYLPEGARPYIDLLRLSLTDGDLIERLAAFRPTHVTAYASVLHELARQIEAGRLALKPELEQVVNISERLVPQARRHYAHVFGTPVLDNYSMGECLFLTNGCTASPGMHVNADWAILEVVDDNNRPVPNGEKGARVLVTNLANHVQPIIRYEIGDIVTIAVDDCGCGSNLPLVAGVEGRDSDLFWIEDRGGLKSLSPAVFEVALSKMLDVREYQLIQDDPRRIRVLVEPLPGRPFERDRAKRILQEALAEHRLGRRIDVELEVVGRLAPEGATKFKRVVSKVDLPPACAAESTLRRSAQHADRGG
jgi:phenylacetate-coenzyme A ligase PaaK-like adenylate-forming protein